MRRTRSLVVLFDGCVAYYAAFFESREAARIFERLRDSCAWRQERARLFGRDVLLPRLTAWYGDAGYRYSSVDHQPQTWTRELAWLRDRVAGACGGLSFNSVLLNRYRNGADGVAWHSDDEPELGDGPAIASLSFGAPRDMQFRSKHPEHRERATLRLEQGSLLLMRGRSQRDFEHRIPKRSPADAVGERINLTFRLIDPRFPIHGSA